MHDSLAHGPVRPVPQQANSGDSQPTPVPLVPPVEAAPPAPQDHAVPAGGPPVDHQTAPDLVAAVRAFIGSTNTDTTTMAAYGFPVFLGQALEAIARDAGRTLQHTVAATLDLGLPFLYCIPGVTECLEGRQQLLRDSCDPYTRRWLEEIVPVDLPTAGLGPKRFTVRVAVAQHREIGLLAAGLGLQKGQCFTLALTAALIGSPYVPMDEANAAMDRTLVESLKRFLERARYTEALLGAPQPEATGVHRTIYDVLAGRPGR